MKTLLKHKKGYTLVEVVVAVAVFAVISTGIMTVMVSSQKVTEQQNKAKPEYEVSVGRMDEMLSSNTSAVAGDDISVSVVFPGGSTSSVDSKVIKDADLQGVAIVKKK